MLGVNELPPVRKNRSLEEYKSETYLGAAFQQSWKEAPLDAIWRDFELRQANIAQGEVKFTFYDVRSPKPVEIPEDAPKVRLSTDGAKAQIKESGLPLKVPEGSYTQSALDIIMGRKRDELMRKDQLERSSGIGAGVGKFTVAMAAQILDPINVASAFVPVVAPARYSAMMTKTTTAMGRAGVRAKVGAVEGLAGAVMVEPFVYFATQREQADYTMADSLINIGLGSVMGAGLHAGAGAVGDALRKGKSPEVATATAQPVGSTAKQVAMAAPETREAMFKTAISQEAQGRRADVEAVAAMDSRLSLSQRSDVFYHGTTKDFAKFDLSRAGEVGEDFGKIAFVTSDADVASGYSVSLKENPEYMGIIKEAEANRAELAKIVTDKGAKFKESAEFKRNRAKSDEIESRRSAMQSDIEEYAIPTPGANVRPVTVKGNLLTVDAAGANWREVNADAIKKAKEGGYDGVRITNVKDSATTSSAKASDVVAVFDAENIESAFAPPKHPEPSRALENTIRNEVKRGSDPEASRLADEAITKTEFSADEELSHTMEEVAELERITGAESVNMAEYDKAIAQAEEDAKALEAAVLCRLTK